MDNLIRFPLSPEKAQDNARAQVARPYLDHLYARYSLNGCKYLWYDGDHEITKRVQLMGADASLLCKKSITLKYIDEKTDFHMPYRFCLEAISNTNTDPQIWGWMRTAKADRLVYSFVWIENILDVFVIDFLALRRWFWKDNNYLNFKEHTMPNTRNNTRSYMPEVDKVWDSVLTYRYLITNQGQVLYVPCTGQDPIDIVRRVLRDEGIPFKKIARDKAS
jgi:hypothetical protein